MDLEAGYDEILNLRELYSTLKGSKHSEYANHNTVAEIIEFTKSFAKYQGRLESANNIIRSAEYKTIKQDLEVKYKARYEKLISQKSKKDEQLIKLKNSVRELKEELKDLNNAFILSELEGN